MKTDLNLLPLFLAVAEERNFRAAADRLGVTRSAISQGMRRLEGQFGAHLVTRTTRAVSLTEAGRRLRDALSRPMAEIVETMERGGDDAAPRGRLKIAVTSIAEQFLSGPLVASFAAAHPQVTLDVTVTDEEFDIVAEGFDAGVRLGDVIEQDMIAVPLTGEQREMVVAAPEYLARHGRPETPSDLLHHRCIGWRPNPRVAPYRWEFEKDGKAFDIAVEPQITSNDLRFLLRAALAGGGVTFATADTFQFHVASGELVSLLEDYLPPFPGFYLYFPRRSDQSPKLRAMIDHVRLARRELIRRQ